MFCKNCEGNNAIMEQRRKCAFFNEMTMGVGVGVKMQMKQRIRIKEKNP
jgi:hypothetical protein